MRIFTFIIGILCVFSFQGEQKRIESSPKLAQAATFSWRNFDSTQESGLYEEAMSSYHRGHVQVKTLHYDDEQYGHSIWLKRSGKKIKAKYFACGDINQRYEEWKENKKIVFACSGAFTTNDFGNPLPVGLTVDNGLVVNKRVNEKMDGLILVYGTGGIAVSDMEEGNLYLKSLNKSVDVRESWDKYELIQWAEKQEATIFQTQLLAFKNSLRLEVHKARRHNRERRILVLARDAQNTLYHIIFDVKEGVYLGDIAQNILRYLNSQNTKVIAMMNLDTGWYNLMKLFDGNEDLVLKHRPDKSPTNLLVYYYEE